MKFKRKGCILFIEKGMKKCYYIKVFPIGSALPPAETEKARKRR